MLFAAFCHYILVYIVYRAYAIFCIALDLVISKKTKTNKKLHYLPTTPRLRKPFFSLPRFECFFFLSFFDITNIKPIIIISLPSDR